ncbi:sugar transferase, partial [Candidatus Oleimmundimicrobium sp.]|uniref:sugar transferase n=1 Tax=Candidatus Oleimmundimicrobium sp. TaxID=3060597 RepID=UPI002715C252
MEENDYIRLPLIKIVFDKILAILLLILTLPISLLICLAIKLEGLFVPKNRGPIFHWEERVSQDKPFNLYKFRILKLGAG